MKNSLVNTIYYSLPNNGSQEGINSTTRRMEEAKACALIADEFAIGFADWKDDNFLMYGNKTYYAKTSSNYFDVTKYAGKEKPTKYYTTKELLEIYKKQYGL